MKFKFGLLPRVVLAIALGVACGFFLPGWATRIALTFNAIFGQFLGFAIPLLILGLVAPGIADLGRNAGRLLALTAALAYAFTLFSGFGTYLTGRLLFPALLEGSAAVLPEEGAALAPYFTVEMPPVMGVMSALVLAFVLGLGMAYIRSVTLKAAMDDFKRIIELVILRVIIPLLPFYIFGIFLSMTQSGQVAGVLDVFVKLIAVIFCMTVVLLLVQFSVAGLAARKNPLKMLRTMLTAYMTALGTQSSAATIPVTLAQTVKLGVRDMVLEKYSARLSGYSTREEAAEAVRALLPEIEKTCCEYLSQQGVDYGAEAELTEMYFPTRRYEQATLPAGEYQALRITLGSGEGHNWWCVMYPAMCIPLASQPADTLDTLPEDFTGNRVEFRFAVYEFFKSLFTGE